MKREANSYSTRTVAAVAYAPTITNIRLFWWIPRIPNFVWLAMIVLTISALSVSVLVRSFEQEREAMNSLNITKMRVENAKGINQQIREKTDRIRNNPEVAANAAQTQLRLIRKNEIVVAVR